MKKGILSNMSSWLELLMLGVFSFGGLVLALLIMSIISGGSPAKMQEIDFMRISQLISVSCIFLIPVAACAYLFHSHPADYLKINRPMNWKFLMYSLLLVIAVQPVIGFTAYYNDQLVLPESLSKIEKVLRDMEDTAKVLTENLLTTDSISILFLNIFVVAIMAGVTEEFFFRGSLQQIFKKTIKNRHVAIWITAFVFSFIHFQFYGFVPRLLLGAILGYIFLWSGNLWIAIIAHTANNLMAILMFHFYNGTPVYEQFSTIGTGDTMWMTAVSILLSGGLLFLMSREYIKNNIEEFSI